MPGSLHIPVTFSTGVLNIMTESWMLQVCLAWVKKYIYAPFQTVLKLVLMVNASK